MIEVEVAILGGGIVGACAALSLSRQGGGVRRQGRPLSQLPLSQRAHGIWSRLPELIGIDGEYQRSGHLKLARSIEDLAALQAYADSSQGFGLDLQIFDRKQLHQRFPWVGRIAEGASFCPDDGHANPRLVSPAFARAARQLGANVLEQSEVSRVEHDGSAQPGYSIARGPGPAPSPRSLARRCRSIPAIRPCWSPNPCRW